MLPPPLESNVAFPPFPFFSFLLAVLHDPKVVLNDASVGHELHVQVRGVCDLELRVAVLVDEALNAPAGAREHNLRRE